MAFGRSKKSVDPEIQEEIQDAMSADPKKLEEDAGPLGRAFIGAVDKAVHLQTGTIRAYVDWLRRQNPDASPAEIQKQMDKHLKRIVSGTGAGAGAAAAVPGVGLVTGTAAIAGESVLFLDLAAIYAVASAYLRGEDVSDPERRKALVLMLLMGSKGLAIVDALIGDDAERVPGRATLAKFSGPTLLQANNTLERVAMRTMTKRLRHTFLSKMMPLGIGAIAGTAANRKLVDGVINNVQSSLGPVPAGFATELPEKETEEEKNLAARLAQSPKDVAAWLMDRFGKSDDDSDDSGDADGSEKDKKTNRKELENADSDN